MKKWQLQEAANNLNKVVDFAIEEGPQIITSNGVEVAVILSINEYKLAAKRVSLYEFFQNSPLVGIELDLARDKSDVSGY